jgi:hypothetical protein
MPDLTTQRIVQVTINITAFYRAAFDAPDLHQA